MEHIAVAWSPEWEISERWQQRSAIGAVDVPWMGDRPWGTEVAGGLSGAIVLPLALSLLWGRLRMAGARNGTFACQMVLGSERDLAKPEVLLSDLQGRTRSWLMSVAAGTHAERTRLYFGSAVVPVTNDRTREARMGFVFRALLGFHKVYSRILLRAAAARVARLRPAPRQPR